MGQAALAERAEELTELKNRVKNGAYISWTDDRDKTLKRTLIQPGDKVEALDESNKYKNSDYVKGDKGTILDLRFTPKGKLQDFRINWDKRKENDLPSRPEHTKNNRVKPVDFYRPGRAMPLPRTNHRRLASITPKRRRMTNQAL